MLRDDGTGRHFLFRDIPSFFIPITLLVRSYVWVSSVVILRCIVVAPQKFVSLLVSSKSLGTGRDEIFRPVDNPSVKYKLLVSLRH